MAISSCLFHRAVVSYTYIRYDGSKEQIIWCIKTYTQTQLKIFTEERQKIHAHHH